jgi:hypothetical protein
MPNLVVKTTRQSNGQVLYGLSRQLIEDGALQEDLNTETGETSDSIRVRQLDGRYRIRTYENPQNCPWSIHPFVGDTTTVAYGRGSFNPETGEISFIDHPYYRNDRSRRPGILYYPRSNNVEITEDYDLMDHYGITGPGIYSYDHSTGLFTAAERRTWGQAIRQAIGWDRGPQ